MLGETPLLTTLLTNFLSQHEPPGTTRDRQGAPPVVTGCFIPADPICPGNSVGPLCDQHTADIQFPCFCCLQQGITSPIMLLYYFSSNSGFRFNQTELNVKHRRLLVFILIQKKHEILCCEEGRQDGYGDHKLQTTIQERLFNVLCSTRKPFFLLIIILLT